MSKPNTKNRKIKNTLTALSNPFSTGGGGVRFECKVQATFVLALLVGGLSPLINVPITSLKFQTKRLNRDIDDLMITSSTEDYEARLFCQIKHGVSFTNNPVFNEVITAAWSDFNKQDFNKRSDKIVLITSLVPKSDVLRFIYAQANASSDERDFINRIEQPNYSNDDNRKKLKMLKDCLCKAKGQSVTDQELWEFCKVFSVLIFDIAYENSINEFLIHALVISNSKASTSDAWYKILDYANNCNINAAHVDSNNIPHDISQLFDKNVLASTSSINIDNFSPDKFIAKLALIGSWNENNLSDKHILESFFNLDYASIQSNVQDTYLRIPSCIAFSNGIWKIKNRNELIEKCSKLYFDNDINLLFQLATTIYQQKDKRIQADGSFNTLIPTNESFDYSDFLRNGILDGIAILSNFVEVLPSCSDNLINFKSREFVKNILSDADSTMWTSLDNSLITIAEISPEEYLSLLENTIMQTPKVIEALFPVRDSNMFFSRNSIFSILWSLESLAWSEDYFISCIRILGELAKLNYEKTNYANTPINSIISILLPWYPQTLATFQKQQNAIKCLQNDSPLVAWKVIKGLLPHATTSTGGTKRPTYIITTLPEHVAVSKKQVFEVQNYYTSLAIELATQDIKKLQELLSHFTDMNKNTATLYLKTILNVSKNWNDEDKYPVWRKMKIHRNLALNNSQKSLDKELMGLLDSVIEKTEPSANIYNFRLLFDSQYVFSKNIEDETSTSKWQERKTKQKEALVKIYFESGIESVIQFANDINDSSSVANLLGQSLDVKELKKLANLCYCSKLDKAFFAIVLHGFFFANNIANILELKLDQYSHDYIAWILTCFPLKNEVFELVDKYLLDDQDLYWNAITIPRLVITEDVDAKIIWSNLIKCNRPAAAINIFSANTNNCNVSISQIEEALISVAIKEYNEYPEPDAVRNLIEYLHINASKDIEKISEIELIYLPWLDEYSKVKPKALRYRLANEPEFFCELIALMYKKKSAKKHDRKISETMSKRLFQIFFQFSVVPGTDWDDVYHEDIFENWITFCKTWGKEKDRYEVIQQTIGNGLSYAKRNENGLIDEFIIKELNKPENDEMRRGFSIGIFNQRGVTWIDPEGKPEYKLASDYNALASKTEELGYSRFAETLHEIANKYTEEAEYNIKRHRLDQETENN